MSLNLENLFFLNIGEIIRVMENNSLIQSYKISKQYPSTLNISIKNSNKNNQNTKECKLSIK